MSAKSATTKCKLNLNGSVCLQVILDSFNSSIREEHAWALCYQLTRFYMHHLRTNAQACYLVTDIKQIYLQCDGNIHPSTVLASECGNVKRRAVINHQEVISALGLAIYNALDHNNHNGEERTITQDLEELISDMIVEERSVYQETDDEGIERDSEEADDSKHNTHHTTLQKILERCERHILTLTKSEAESHYRAVVRALVAEALELASFLETVKQGNFGKKQGNSSKDLDQLQFADWARFWVQVISELRQGVKLKKVNFSRAPIEFEMTPYEILMKDIRSCRYNLRKILVNGAAPSRVTKDAHDIILDFIRSRPPLKKASDRKLAPRQCTYTPHDQLMNSIRRGRKLRTTQPPTLTTTSKDDSNACEASDSQRRVIKVDFAQFNDDDEDSDSSESGLSYYTNDLKCSNLEAYDLALECNLRPAGGRRHTLSICSLDPDLVGSQSVPQSRPDSRQSCASSDNESIHLAPELAKAIQDNSKPWHEAMSLDDRLSLTLEEIVHIRTVLTKAELEALPVEGHVRGDVENRKVCFLCLKTRFGILGPWGHRCTLCKRTVCSKCCSKMNIPMEHFSSVPVVLLSPSIMATPEDEYSSTFARPQPNNPRSGSSIDRFRLKAKAVGNAAIMVDRLRNSQMLVCYDCKMLVFQIIKSAQANRSAIRNKHLQNLTLDLAIAF